MISNIFKDEFDIEHRIKKFVGVYKAGKVPVIILLHENVVRMMDDERVKKYSKYVKVNVDGDKTYRELMIMLRKFINLESSAGLYLFNSNGGVVVMTREIGIDYKENLDKEDGFLYLSLYAENTFG